MDKYYKWDGTAQGVEGLELFLGKKVVFNTDLNIIGIDAEVVHVDETVVVLSEGDVFVVEKDVNVDAAIAQYRASRVTKAAAPPLNPDAPTPDEEYFDNVRPPLFDAPAYEEGTFEWALIQLGRGNAIRCTAWKPGRVLTQDEAANGKWELA